jgi:hypothetical protein
MRVATQPATAVPACFASCLTVPKPTPKQKTATKPKTAANNDTTPSAANVGYEAHVLQIADALRGSMDAAKYKHVVLGLISLKYISDAFEEQHARLAAEKSKGADPKIPTSTARCRSSGCRPRRVGRISRRRRSNPASVS